MKIALILVSAILTLAITSIPARDIETYFMFKVDSPEEVRILTRIISIDNVQNGTVWAYANNRELRAFEEFGYEYTVLPHPSTLIQPRMADSKRGMTDWDAYPTYGAYDSMMYQFATDYPDICQVFSVGTSVQGRDILYAKISDNVSVEEDEPEVMHTSSMHGDETTGYVLLLRLIDSLLVSYGTDPYITRLVDSMEIWINPLANPDGTYHDGDHTVYGATRYNANSVDLNRNFPDPEDGPHPDGNSWQPETVIMMELAEAQSFIISANHHGGAEVVNYPWDTWSQRHADDDWWQDICHKYADTAHYYSPAGYMSGYNDGITNGWDWYTISGGRQDYMNYWQGCREVTLEISGVKLLPAYQLPDLWDYNKRSLLQWLENALYGIRGVVTDASTLFPIASTITVIGHDIDSSQVRTDPDVGNYHRMIEEGIYYLEFSAPGYYSDTALAVTAVDAQATIVDMALTPLTDDPVLTFADHDTGPIDPGDTVSMSIILTNSGAGNASSVSGTLSSTDSYITVTQPVSSYPNIQALGGTETSISEYEFEVSSSCPLYYTVQFRLDISAAGGYSDSAFFNVIVGQLVEDFETADFGSFPWEMSGTSDWTIVSSGVYEGSYATQSGNITHNQYSQLSLTADVSSSGDVSFYYKVSSESGWDYLRFLIDDVEQDAWSGDVSWTQASYPVTAGTHTFAWKYEKDGGVDGGSDQGWVDLITLPPVSSSLAISTLSLPDWTIGETYSQQFTATGGMGGLTWIDKYDDLSGSGLSVSSSGLVFGIPSGTGTLEFTAEVSDGAGSSDERLYNFSINIVPTITTSSVPDGQKGEYYSQQLQAVGGTNPLTWTDLSGNLTGTGLALSLQGLLNGTPTISGMISFTAKITDTAGADDSKPYSFEIHGGCCVDTTGNVILDVVTGDCDGPHDQTVDIADLTNLIDHLFIGYAPICCLEEADITPLIDGGTPDQTADIADLTALIDHLFINYPALPACP